MSDVYSEWKPLRNLLGKMDVNDSLGVIRAYSVRTGYRGQTTMPYDIEVHPWIDKPNVFLPWELEALAREVIICSPCTPAAAVTMRKSKQIANGLNGLKRVENYIETTYLNQGNIYHDFTVRLAHKQFKYQTDRPSIEWLIRWSKIFMHPDLAPIVESKTDLNPQKLFTLGAGLWGNYLDKYGMFFPLTNLSLTGITDDDYRIFMEFFSIPMSDMKALLLDPSERHMDENFFYGYTSLTKYPLLLTNIEGKPAHVCPLPTLLYWRITSGLYYDLVGEPGFDNAFGKANEDYVGSVFDATFAGTPITIYPGEPNTASSPNRCDWVIDQPNEALIVECKTKRLTLGAKISLLDQTELEAQLGKLAGAVCQAYQSLWAYRQGSYPSPTYQLDSGKKAYIAVTTLEKWYLMGDQVRTVDRLVREKVAAAGLLATITDESPYIVASVDDIEEFAYLAKTHKISEIIQPYTDSRLSSGYEFATYLSGSFKTDLAGYEYVFDGELQNSFTVLIDESKRTTSRKKKDDL